ncbi:hypothetical protein DFP73DRAFT_562486 [Morchella snyderi]|nr:hypothetical protein DFP73DRAFT_562486 [Morchella snyderi]
MRASLTAAVTAFTAPLPPASEQEREGHRQLHFLRRLTAGEVSGRELVSWADTITAALIAFSAPGPPRATSCSMSTSPPESHGTTPPPPLARSRSQSSAHHSTATGCSAAIRNSTLARDGHACVHTGRRDAEAIGSRRSYRSARAGRRPPPSGGYWGSF